MKTFKRRPGVELLEICGEYLLVSTRQARDHCPYVTQINTSAADYWRMIEGPCSVGELVERIARQYGKDSKDVLLPVLLFVGKMTKSGYLIEEASE